MPLRHTQMQQSRQNLQIRRIIVRLIAVNVMDVLVRPQLTTELLRHHLAMHITNLILQIAFPVAPHTRPIQAFM